MNTTTSHTTSHTGATPVSRTLRAVAGLLTLAGACIAVPGAAGAATAGMPPVVPGLCVRTSGPLSDGTSVAPRCAIDLTVPAARIRPDRCPTSAPSRARVIASWVAPAPCVRLPISSGRVVRY